MTNSLLYFDTNVHDLVALRDEARALREALERRGQAVLGSGLNLLEFWRVPDYAGRRMRVSAIRTLAARYVEPHEWHQQGQQVLGEVQRLRPHWLGRSPSAHRSWVIEHLQGYRALWKQARDDPGTRPASFKLFMDGVEDRLAAVRQMQKALRKKTQDAAVPRDKLLAGFEDPRWDALARPYGQDERMWRANAVISWKEVLQDRDTAIRDVREWPRPGLIRMPPDEDDYLDFWWRDVNPDAVPLMRMIGLVEWEQSKYRPGYGNLFDLFHAGHLLDTDAVLTADRDFYNILCAVRCHFPNAGVPIFIDKEAANAEAEILTALKGAGL